MTDAPVQLPSIAVLGLGSMGGAILSGLLAPGVEVQGGVRVTNRDIITQIIAADLTHDVVLAAAYAHELGVCASALRAA